MRAALVALALAGCNSILGNGDFKGPGGDDTANGDGGVDACSGIGCMVTNCADQGKPPTSLSGTVFAPDGTLPLYNAMVYVPTGPLAPLGDGPASRACASGDPAVHTLTDVRGHFKLDNVPSVPNLPVVIQVGKWRRELTVPTVNDCADLVLPATATRLPRNSSEGHLPRIAVTTGAAESLECVLRSLGVDDAEHSNGTGAGRIHLYKGMTAMTSQLPGGVAIELVDALYNRMPQYDQLLFSCDGQALVRPAPVLANMRTFVDAGGWVWLSHYHYSWVTAPAPFPPFAQFMQSADPPSPVTTRIDTATPKGQAFSDWMVNVGASPQPGLLAIQNGRNTCMNADLAIVERFVYLDPSISAGFSGVQLLTWTTPAASGGRVVFSDIHTKQPVGGNTVFPSECVNTGFTPQDKSIAFQLFDQPVCLN